MKKIILGFIIAAIVLVGGFFVLNNYFKPVTIQQSNTSAPRSADSQNNEAVQPEEAVYCDVQKNSCSSYQKTENSGDLKIIVTSKEKLEGNLEVDVAYKPGAPQFYMKTTDDKGIALFNDLPAGNYKIYFNLNNFPAGYDAMQTFDAKVIQGQMSEVVVELKK